MQIMVEYNLLLLLRFDSKFFTLKKNKMKKIFLGLTMLFSFIAFSNISHAQVATTTAATDAAKVTKTAKKAKKTVAKAKTTAIAAQTDAATATTAATTAKTKVKKAKVAATTATTAATTTAVVAPATATKAVKAKAVKAVANPINKTADKAIGTDAKGRTIYQGPKGGKYTLSPSGNKEYIKQ